MVIDTTKLKDISIKLDYKLRFPIRVLKIKIDDDWKTFENFITPQIAVNDRILNFKTKLEFILLDTGNEAKDYSVLSCYYFDVFKNKIKAIETDENTLSDYRGNKIVTHISTEIFEFNFLDCKFYSKIGFTNPTNMKALDTFNIGINSIKQFLNVIFPNEESYYYYCSNI